MSDSSRGAAMTPKTQSVCKYCGRPIKSGEYCRRHRNAEPASTKGTCKCIDPVKLMPEDKFCDYCGKEIARPSEPSSFEGIPKGIANTASGPEPAAPPASQTPQSVIEAATELLDAMETCHVCKGMIFLQEYTVHCEDCPSDCENHEGQECAPIYDLHAKLRKLLKLATPASTARTDGWVSVEERLPGSVPK